MEVDLAVLADAANTTENGKLNILGIFDSFTLGPEFPAASPTFALVIRIVAHPSECGEHGLTVRLADADGMEFAKLEAGFDIPSGKPRGKPVRLQLVLGSQVTFPGSGEYAFDVLIDGRWEKSIPMEVLSAPPS